MAESSSAESRGFEVSDANPRALALAGVLLVVFLAASMALIAAVYRSRIGARSNSAGEGFRGGSGYRTAIEEDWQALDAENAGHLGGYRWIDKQRGVVQIPIERAMEIIAGKETSP